MPLLTGGNPTSSRAPQRVARSVPGRVKVRPNDVTLLHETRGTVPWSIFPRCPRVLQAYPTMWIAPKCPNSRIPSYPTLLETLTTPWDSVEQCPMGTMSLVARSKVASSGPTLKVHPDDATLLHETRDSVPMEHWSTLSQVLQVFRWRIARAGSTPPVALKMSSREGLGAILHEAKLHRVEWP